MLNGTKIRIIIIGYAVHPISAMLRFGRWVCNTNETRSKRINMLKFLRKHLSDSAAADAQPPPLELAAAMLFLDTAYADGNIAEAELSCLQQALIDTFNMSADAAADLIAQARSQLDNATGMYVYTRRLREAWSVQQRQQLLQCLWAIAMADDHIDNYEESHLRQLADQLGLMHQEYVQAKHQADLARQP